MDREDFLAAVAQLHDEWEEKARFRVDPEYATNDPSQYAENVEAMSAAYEDDLEFLRRYHELEARYEQSVKAGIGRPSPAE